MPVTIDITIKTLDGNSRKFENISNGLTVKEFKEKIASKVGICAAQQRLISAGRVLNDESLLSSLNLDGQTIHLVERRPIPNQPPPATDAPTNRPRAPNQRPPRQDVPPWFGGPPMMQTPFRMQIPRRPPASQFQGPRNAGPRVAGPPNLGRPATNPLDAGSNRVEHCRRFIDNAKHVLYHLKRLKASILGTSSEEPAQSTTSETEASNGPTSSEASNSGSSSAVEENQGAPESNGVENTRRPQSEGNNNNRQLPRAYPASEIISLHRLVRNCENELQEYVDLCEQLMTNESTEMSRETRRLHEKLVHGIGEATHFLAHAQHSLSDLFTDFTQQPRLSLAVPTPMGQLTTASIGIRNIVPAPHGTIRIPVPVAPPQFVEPFVPPHQRPPSSDNNQESETVTNAPPNAENSNTGPTYTNSFPHDANPFNVQFPPNASPINVQQFSVRGNPATVIRASFRPMVPTTATTTRPSTLQENGTVRNDQSSQNSTGPTPPEHPQPTLQSQPHQHVFDARTRTIGPRDPFVPCSSRFFNNFPANPNQGHRTNSTNRNAGDGTEPLIPSNNDNTLTPNDNSETNGTIDANRTDEANMEEQDGAAMEQSLQDAMHNMMGGIPGIAFEVNSNVVPVDPSRPIGEQIQQIINTSGLPAGQMDPIAGQLEQIFHTSLPLVSGMEATNIFFSDVQVMQDSMDPSDEQYSEEHDRSNENNQAIDQTRAPPAENPMENIFGNIMQGLFEQQNNEGSTSGQVPTLYDIFRGHAAVGGLLQDIQNSITTDIISCFCRFLSLANIFPLVNGDSSSLAASRPSFRRLIDETVLQGHEFSDELLRSRTRHLVEIDQALGSFSSASTATIENINMRETINNFLTQRLYVLFSIGLNSEITDAQYCEQVRYSLTHSLHEFLVLVNAVLQPPQDIGNFMMASGGLMGAFGVRGENTNQPAGFINLLNSMVGQQLRVLSQTASSHVRVSDVEHFIVRTPSAENNETSQNVASEPMNTSDNTAGDVSSESSPPVRPKTVPSTAIADSIESLLGDEPPLNLFGGGPSETFAEFLEHTLQRDSEKEKQLSEPQPFFSDAYLLGMPPRHRQAAETASGAVGFSNSVPNLLDRALSAPQFSDISQEAREDMRTSVQENPQIDNLFADVLRHDFRERAERDPDLRKRPSIKKFIDGS